MEIFPLFLTFILQIITTKNSNLNESLSGKVGGFTNGDYAAVTGLAYDATNKKLGLKVGADTVIPFKNGATITTNRMVVNSGTLGAVVVGSTVTNVKIPGKKAVGVLDFQPTGGLGATPMTGFAYMLNMDAQTITSYFYNGPGASRSQTYYITIAYIDE